MGMYGTQTLSTNSLVVTIGSSSANIIAVPTNTRISMTVQNTSTYAVLIAQSSSISSTSYNAVLSADTSTRQGGGGSVEMNMWKGYVSAYTECTGSVTFAVTEEIEQS